MTETMIVNDPPRNLGALLSRLERAGRRDEPVCMGDMLKVTGHRSFGALLLVPGLLVLSPLSGIPGFPTMCAVMVSLIALQLLVGRKHFWLPQWLLHRSAPRSKYQRAIRFLKKPARFVDRLLRRRLTFLTKGIAVRMNAVLCLLIAATMPPLELIPFGNSTAGAALSVLGVGLIARDGAMVLAAMGFFGILLYLVIKIWT